MTEVLGSLLSRRLLLVTGKGGTGKSSIAAALGVLAARSGVRTVVVELGEANVLRDLLVAPGSGDRPLSSRDPEPVGAELFALRIDPMEALREYLELQLHVRLLARAIVGNSAFHRFLEAAPGWRELVTLGKLWYLVSREDHGRPRWPLVIVDAPATGHGLSLLSVPSVVRDTVRVGPLRRNTDPVHELVTDPARTWLLPITLPEELPVRETLELRARVRELGVGLGPVIANGVEPALALADPERVLACVAALPRAGAPSPLAAPAVVEAAARHRLARGAMQRGFLAELTRALGEPARELPWLAQGVDGPEGVRALADALGGALA